MKTTASEFRKYRFEMNERILNSGFRDFNKFFALDNKAYVNGALPAKTKELMGLTASMVLRCNDCILYQSTVQYRKAQLNRNCMKHLI